MKTKLTQIFLLLLCLILSIAVLSACKPGGDPANTDTDSGTSSESQSDSETEKPEEPTYIIKDGKTEYTIIRGADRRVSEERPYSNRIKEAFEKLGITVECKEDMDGWDDTSDPETKEILIGHTNRPETQKVLDELRYNDYAVVKEGNKIVVTAHSFSGLNKAVNYFINRVMSNKVEENGKCTELEFKDSIVNNAKYGVDSVKIAGVELKNYRIVYPESTKVYFKDAAESWSEDIANKYGYVLEVVSDKKEATDYEILIGKTNRTDAASEYESHPLKSLLMGYRVLVKGKKIIINCGGAYSASASATEFMNKAFDKKEVTLDDGFLLEGTLMKEKAVPLTEGADIRIMSANILAEFASWNLENVTIPIPPRVEIFVANLLFYSPDAIGIQEATPLWIKYLKFYLADTPYKVFGEKRDDGGDNYSSLIYNAEKYDLEAEGFQQYSKHASAVCRNMKWGIFKNKTTGVRFGLVSTHWDFGDEPNKVECRTTQVKEMAALVDKLYKQYDCTITTTGDYNCSESSTSYSLFMSINNMYDSKFAAEKRYNLFGSCHTLGLSNISTGSIDCVFATKEGAKVLGYMTVVGNGVVDLSDHNPVFADIAVKK